MKKIIILLSIAFLMIACSKTAKKKTDKDKEDVDKCLISIAPSVCMKELASADNMIAQYQLGEMYIGGHGVKKDYKKALDWYVKSSDQGYDPATDRIERFRKSLLKTR